MVPSHNLNQLKLMSLRQKVMYFDEIVFKQAPSFGKKHCNISPITWGKFWLDLNVLKFTTPLPLQRYRGTNDIERQGKQYEHYILHLSYNFSTP